MEASQHPVAVAMMAAREEAEKLQQQTAALFLDTTQQRSPVTQEMLISGTRQRLSRNEPAAKFLQRITHLSLNGRHLTTLAGLDKCPNVKVLYLYGNDIDDLGQELAFATGLTHLYLQNNHLITVGRVPLTNLTKLFLDGNCISHVEGLECAGQLQELHLAGQRLSDNECLTFAPETLDALAETLTVLNVANNRMMSCEDLTVLHQLERLNISRNWLTEIEQVAVLLQDLPNLVDLDVRHNPVSVDRRFRDKALVFSSEILYRLDDVKVAPHQRQMVIALEEQRRRRRIARQRQARSKRPASAHVNSSAARKQHEASQNRVPYSRYALDAGSGSGAGGFGGRPQSHHAEFPQGRILKEWQEEEGGIGGPPRRTRPWSAVNQRPRRPYSATRVTLGQENFPAEGGGFGGR